MNGKYTSKKILAPIALVITGVIASLSMAGCGSKPAEAKEPTVPETTWVEIGETPSNYSAFKACVEGRLFFAFYGSSGSTVLVPDEQNECADGLADPVSTR